MRVATFVAGGFLPTAMIGHSHPGLMHIADWLATFCDIAGLDPRAGEGDPIAPLDSVSAWAWISGKEAHSAREEMVLDHRMCVPANLGPFDPSACPTACPCSRAPTRRPVTARSR